MALCRHVRRGIVTNQPDGYDPNQPHAAASVCQRPTCIETAQSWVASKTNQTAVYVSDASRRSA